MEHQYLELLSDIISNGTVKSDRTGTGTMSVFGRQLRFSCSQGFPLITTKKVHFHSVLHELLWFLRGDSNTQYLKDNKVSIWDEWADEQGNLGPIYGVQWRKWNNKIDQISSVINQIKNNPDSRRHIVSAWNVEDLAKMALAPCHVLFQFYVSNNNLSCLMFQRSADVFLGLPFNIASYALLTHIIANICDMNAHELIISIGDAHLYLNHIDQAKTQLSRSIKQPPQLVIKRKLTSIDDINYNDFELINYEPHPTIKAPIAV